MGKPRKIKSPEDMAKAWEKFKEYCDNQEATVYEFSQKNAQFISANVRKKITYTIVGFCVFLGLDKSSFYETYEEDPAYTDIVKRIKVECEADVRAKFENGTIPHQLAALWMSKFGYSTKNDTNINGNIPVVIEDDLNKK